MPVRVRPRAPFSDFWVILYKSPCGKEQKNSAIINKLLKELKTGLHSLYGGRLHGIYLYGSCARREAGRESDVDILVVLDSIPSYSAEVDRTSALIASLSLKHSVSVSRVFVSLHDWQRGQTPFLLDAREEAIVA